MSEAAPVITPPAAPAAAPTAGVVLSPTPAAPDWASSFQDADLKGYVAQKGFKSIEAITQSYRELEKKIGSRVSEERTIILPEKMEGDNVRPIFERLGAPKTAKEYELPKFDGQDEKFQEWAESTFHKSALTKSQAANIVQSLNERNKALIQAQTEAKENSLKQADIALQKHWGAQYEANLNVAKQGARALGLDAKALDKLEETQGREQFFKNLYSVGVKVGEPEFINGKLASDGSNALTPEQAHAEILALTKDKDFSKALRKGSVEALNKWQSLHEAAYPGQKQIG